MTMPERDETGGASRTPRSEIGPAVSANRKKEPILLLDLSTSMDWEAALGEPEWNGSTGGRRGVVIDALAGLVAALEDEDSEAAGEQAAGSDDRGGLLCHGFGNEHIEIGDLNSANLQRRLNQIPWGGRTYVMPAWRAALADYDEEFGDRDPDEQPVLLTLVLTDGEADDWEQFSSVLEKATAKRVFVVAIVGYGERHDATLRAYQDAAKRNTAQDKFGKQHVRVVSFDSVTDPQEIAMDLITLLS
ncbi:MAG TPA: vWA domain-containing protein [Streptosporangiaceae bacterium]|nr:vWA domain-containing protein [Streptosporangiaceae bacterium]